MGEVEGIEFKFEKIVVTPYGKPKSYLRVSVDINGMEFYDHCRIYWGGFVWGYPLCKIRILKRILKTFSDE